MNLIPSFLRRKKKTSGFLVITQPPIWVESCASCGYEFWSTLVEGNHFPLGCPNCGYVHNERCYY
jgi:predicted RNA-binding Zn-ribbon protein involved in translation (DUF1610 family)